MVPKSARARDARHILGQPLVSVVLEAIRTLAVSHTVSLKMGC
jgi:hypothetical protein